jgi:hypothetical protein
MGKGRMGDGRNIDDGKEGMGKIGTCAGTATVVLWAALIYLISRINNKQEAKERCHRGN